MNVRRPEVSHVAVRDGWILGAGTLDELAGWARTKSMIVSRTKPSFRAWWKAIATAAKAAAGTRLTSDSMTAWRRTGWLTPDSNPQPRCGRLTLGSADG